MLFYPIYTFERFGLGQAAGASALLSETITSPVYAYEIPREAVA
jgi:hypothetical protein